MTLMEVLVALAIMGLAVGTALALLGPWLRQAALLESQSRFRREAGVAQMVVAELAAGLVDGGERFERGPDALTFETFAPRLSPTPVRIRLRVVHVPEGDRLVAEGAALRSAAPLLDRAPPLRLGAISDSGGPRGLTVEAKIAGAWEPVIIAPVFSTAPVDCRFDAIAGVCR